MKFRFLIASILLIFGCQGDQTEPGEASSKVKSITLDYNHISYVVINVDGERIFLASKGHGLTALHLGREHE